MKLRIFFVILVTLALTSSAFADKALDRAREHFDNAQSAYAKGDYDKAAAEFELAYNARAFPQFLFNIGAAHEKAKRFQQAIDYYERYLVDLPEATDKDEVAKRVEALKKEIKRVEELKATDPDPENPDQPAPEVDVTKVEEEVGEVKVRGLVVIESEPQNAYIYLDDPNGPVFARTPWSGSLEGEHTIFIKRQGYKPREKRIAPDPNHLLVLDMALAEIDYLGYIEITSTPPGAKIYIDKKEIGAYDKTPFKGQLEPGIHKFWIEAEGHDPYYEEIDVIAGEVQKIHAELSGDPVGYLNFRGAEMQYVTIYMDGEVLCETGPCRKAVKQGNHTIQVKRGGYKTYTTQLDVQAATEITIRPMLAKKPGRGDAVWAYIFAAAFTGGGVFAGLQANSIHDEIQADIDAGMPPPDPDDPRFLRGKIFAIGANVGYALGGISLLTAIYYTFRDKGVPSTGTIDLKAVAIQPQIGPGYAGMGVGVSW